MLSEPEFSAESTFATRLDHAGVNLAIQKLMGHSDIKTAARHVGVVRRRWAANEKLS